MASNLTQIWSRTIATGTLTLTRATFSGLRAAALCSTLVSSSCVSTAKQAPPSNLQLADRYAQDGLYREAIDHYGREISGDPNNYTAHRNLGIVLIRVGEYKRAAESLKRSAPAFENNFEMNYYLGEALRASEVYGDAIYRYQKALSIRPEDPRALKALTWSYFKIRYYTEALSNARKLVKIAPRDQQAAIILARTYMKLHDHKSAYRTLKSVKGEADSNQLAYIESVEGDVWAAAGQCKKAVDLYRSALRQQPLLAGAALGLGKCELASGSAKSAIPYLERAIRLRPQLHEALFYLGKAHESVDAKKATRYFRSFVKRAVSDPELTAEINLAKNALSKSSITKGAGSNQL